MKRTPCLIKGWSGYIETKDETVIITIPMPNPERLAQKILTEDKYR